MRVFFAGSPGTLGSRVLPALVSRGHEIIGTTTSREASREARAWALANGVIVDVLDAEAVTWVLRSASPEVVVHEATALRGRGADLRRLPPDFEVTNRVRTSGTDNLVAAAGAGRMTSHDQWLSLVQRKEVQ